MKKVEISEMMAVDAGRLLFYTGQCPGEWWSVDVSFYGLWDAKTESGIGFYTFNSEKSFYFESLCGICLTYNFTKGKLDLNVNTEKPFGWLTQLFS